MKILTEGIPATQLPESLIKTLSLKAKKLGAVNLGQGIPEYPAPESARTAACEALSDFSDPTIDQYPDYQGVPELRQELAQLLSRESNVSISGANILVTAGAMEAGQTALTSIVFPGDTVGVVTPDYATHFSQLKLPYAEECHVPMTEKGRWELDVDRIEDAAFRGLRALLITNPNNPTGSVVCTEQLAQINELSQKYGFWVISDETYSYLTYDRPFASFLQFMNDNDRAVVTRSFSKEHCMTGWRVGYLVAQTDVVQQFLRVHDSLVGTAPRISQMAALGVVKGSQEHVVKARREFGEKRTYVLEQLNSMPGLSVIAPEGAYYVFPRYEQDISSFELSRLLLEQYGVNVIPGAIFGEGAENHFRISMGPEMSRLAKGMNRIGDYFSDNAE